MEDLKWWAEHAFEAFVAIYLLIRVDRTLISFQTTLRHELRDLRQTLVYLTDIIAGEARAHPPRSRARSEPEEERGSKP